MNAIVKRAFSAGFVLAMLGGCAGAQHSIPSLNADTANGLTVATSGSGRDVVADVPPTAGGHDLGRAPSNLQLSIAVTLQYRNQQELAQFIASQEELPAGSHPHWLTDAQFDARFAPSQGDYTRVIASLQRAGLRITQQFENRTVIDAVGSAGALEAYFGTQIHRVAQSGHEVGYENVRPAYAPANLQGILLGVDGLSTLPMVHVLAPAHQGGGGQPDAMREASSKKLFGPPNPTRQPNSLGYGPAAFQRAYDFPIVHATGKTVYDGRGRAAAFILDADFLDSDVTAFTKYFGVTRPNSNTVRVKVDGGSPPGDESVDSIYSTFIAETIAGLAPGAHLYAYETHPGLAANTITDTYNRIVSDNRVDVVVSPFGNCDAAIASIAKVWSAIAEQGLAKGIVFVAGSGDSGGIRCTTAPASSPNFTAIGGTALTIGAGGKWFAEAADLFSSGGTSLVFPMPSWQNGVSGTVAGGRNVPDVAFDSFPTEGGAGYLGVNLGWSSGINPFSGTGLLAAPLYAAALTQVDQLKNERTGLASEKLFGVWKTTGYGTSQHPYFHDETEGGSGLHFAQPGYDFVTGIGSVDFWNLAQKL